ncbi:MAG: hypothetical protein AAFR96_11780 [Planctomycetota bacterium]
MSLSTYLSYRLHIVSLGWPFPSLTAISADEYGVRDPSHCVPIHVEVTLPDTGLASGLQLRDWSILPIMPLTSGFALNSLIYGASLLVFVFSVVRLASWVRSRRLAEGQCVACRYEIMDLAVCPECGAGRP